MSSSLDEVGDRFIGEVAFAGGVAPFVVERADAQAVEALADVTTDPSAKINRWFRIRQRKRQQDIIADTEDAVEPPKMINTDSELPKATRRARIKRERNAVSGNERDDK